ncbi:MAG TPA: glutamate--tRNA ligase, partial [Cyclobacteriaceae bacterium]|nr:glutamate--tRNA ligase [Cyclobacteriaceae bacterium]
QAKFLFAAPTQFDDSVVSKKWNDEAIAVITAFKNALAGEASINAASAKSVLESAAASVNIGVGKIMQALRVAITGNGSGPDLMMTMEIIGKDAVIKRLDHAVNTLKVKA